MAGMIPFFASLKTLITETERNSATSCAVKALFDLAIWSAKVPVTSGSEAVAVNREHGAVHHLPTAFRTDTDLEFWPDLRIAVVVARHEIDVLAMPRLAPPCALDSDASIVPIPSACRRAVRSSGTRLRHSSRLPEVPQALPVF